MTEYGKQLGNIVGTTLIGIIALASLFVGNNIGVKQGKKYLAPTNASLEDKNNDSLPDLVYKTGEIYFQTKEGNFVSYEEVLKQEKAKIDSTYKAEADSLKKVFENKLEKEIK